MGAAPWLTHKTPCEQEKAYGAGGSIFKPVKASWVAHCSTAGYRVI